MSWACQLVTVSCMTCHEEYTYDPTLTTNVDEGPECPPCTALLIEKIILINTGKVTLQ